MKAIWDGRTTFSISDDEQKQQEVLYEYAELSTKIGCLTSKLRGAAKLPTRLIITSKTHDRSSASDQERPFSFLLLTSYSL